MTKDTNQTERTSVAGKTIIEIPLEKQEEMKEQLRKARFGYLLALHILLLCGDGKTPTEIAMFLYCSRTSVYRAVAAYQAGRLDELDEENEDGMGMGRASNLTPTIKRSLLSLVKHAPSAYGWCRTRWSCAALALQLEAQRGLTVTAETVRRWLKECDYVWKRAKLSAKDPDPERITKLAKIRFVIENLLPTEALVFADELDINLLAKVGYQWMLKGTQEEIPTPGKNDKRYLAGALDFVTGKIVHCVWACKVTGLFLDLLTTLEFYYPKSKFTRIYVVVDNFCIHKSAAALKWLADHPRVELLFLPTYCPKANPIERAFGDVHDKCTRNHKRKRLRDLVSDVKQHLQFNGPWLYKLSRIYYEPAVTEAMSSLKKKAA
jgi:transposase